MVAIKVYDNEDLIDSFEIEDSEYISAIKELDTYIYVLDRCDFDRGVTDALLENPVTLLENIKRCVASKCSTEMTRTILLEGLV